MGKLVHALVEKTGIQFDIVMCNDSIAIYVKCLRIEEECHVFIHISERDSITGT